MAGAARLTIRDRGIGIPEEDRARIFGRFERAVTRREHGGFGIGLWLANQLVTAMGGTIAVESTPGEGTTFTVILPLAGAEQRGNGGMTEVSEIERVPSGIPGLDTVLRGGFPQGGIHMIQGTPGAGKTILGNQICFHHAAAGGRALYVTLLAESHARMLLHLGTMRFFDASRLPDQVSYVSGLGALEGEGLPGLLSLLRREVAARKATVLVLDGMVAAEDRATSDTEFKKFIQELQAQVALHGCTAFLLTTAKGQAVAPEHTMVDSIVELADIRYGSRTERGLSVNKLRGSDYLPGRHPFRITRRVWWSIRASRRRSARARIPTRPGRAGCPRASRASTRCSAAALPGATVTGVLGPSGIGKTTLGLHFVCASSAAEPGLLFGFYETPPRLVHQAARLGLDLEGAAGRGEVEIIWQPLGENVQDALAHRLLDAVERRGVRRLFLDGLGGFIEASVEPGRDQPLLLGADQRAAGARRDHALHHGDAGRGRPRHRAAGDRDLVHRREPRCAALRGTPRAVPPAPVRGEGPRQRLRPGVARVRHHRRKRHLARWRVRGRGGAPERVRAGPAGENRPSSVPEV